MFKRGISMSQINDKIKAYSEIIVNEIKRINQLKIKKSKSNKEREYWERVIRGLLIDLRDYRKRYERKTMSIEDLIRMFFGDDFFEEI